MLASIQRDLGPGLSTSQKGEAHRRTAGYVTSPTLDWQPRSTFPYSTFASANLLGQILLYPHKDSFLQVIQARYRSLYDP